MNIKTVTITGADNSIEPKALIELSQKFPFVEWGILLSESQCGGKRFPGQPWVKQLYKECSAFVSAPQIIRVSAHICGKWVGQFLKAQECDFRMFLGDAIYMFKRIQINTHAQPHQVNRDVRAMLKQSFRYKQIIIQFDGVNECLYDLFKNWHVDVRPLYDLSGGAGIVPDKWCKPIDEYTGYAGGLGPDNLKEQLQKIESVVGDKTIWIDMETQIRSDNDMLFDLKKVRKCLEIVQEYTDVNKAYLKEIK